eukprot:15457780-Alexandrium_andersonii.AAC.1
MGARRSRAAAAGGKIVALCYSGPAPAHARMIGCSSSPEAIIGDGKTCAAPCENSGSDMAA